MYYNTTNNSFIFLYKPNLSALVFDLSQNSTKHCDCQYYCAASFHFSEHISVFLKTSLNGWSVNIIQLTQVKSAFTVKCLSL